MSETQDTWAPYPEAKLRAALTAFADVLCEGDKPLSQPTPAELALGIAAMRAAIEAYEGTHP